MATKNVRVGEYRDLYDRVSYWLGSYSSAATSTERRKEAAAVLKASRELANARCSRATQRDHDMVTRILDQAVKVVEKELGK